MDYLLLKHAHEGLAAVSIAGFTARWMGRLRDWRWPQTPFARVAPHVLDTLFLGSGIWLAAMLAQYPFAQPWLTAKLLGLIAYIVLGSLALKLAGNRLASCVAFGAAALTFAWIVSVALSHSPWGFLGRL